jgi:hypothetical protein
VRPDFKAAPFGAAFFWRDPSEITGAIEVVDKLLFSMKVLPTAELKRRSHAVGK